jgi:23S rRNA (pseudouridine1915-N3)-methyltransferase
VTFYLAAVGSARSGAKVSPAAELSADFLTRISRYMPCESVYRDSEAALLKWVDHRAGRTSPHLILLDSRGRQLSSEEFAAHVGATQDAGTQAMIVAVGPPNGWSAEARQRAGLLLSLGRMTLPHELARAVAAEQVYRALTILAGHPYHSGH